jgi:hypothetical protein
LSARPELLARELLARASALRSKAAVKADELAVRSSITLTRVVFLGLLLLPLFEPNSFYIVRAGRVSSPPEVELHARLQVPPIVPTVPPGSDVKTQSPSSDKSTDLNGPNVPASNNPPSIPALPAETEAATKPIPPAKQIAPPWTDAEVLAAKEECGHLLTKTTVVSEELAPVREGICGAPAPRLLRSVGESKVKFVPAVSLDCKMIAGLNTWISDKLQPAAQKNFGSPIVRVVSGSYSCRNRYGLARAPISEHAFMNAIDVSAFVLADGKIVRVSKNWGPTADELKRAQKSNDAAAAEDKAKFKVAASKLGAHDIAKKNDEKQKSEEKPKSPGALKEERAKQAMSAFLHQAHDSACDIFGTVLGPDTNDAHHDHFHLDMKERKRHRTFCE